MAARLSDLEASLEALREEAERIKAERKPQEPSATTRVVLATPGKMPLPRGQVPRRELINLKRQKEKTEAEIALGQTVLEGYAVANQLDAAKDTRDQARAYYAKSFNTRVDIKCKETEAGLVQANDSYATVVATYNHNRDQQELRTAQLQLAVRRQEEREE